MLAMVYEMREYAFCMFGIVRHRDILFEYADTTNHSEKNCDFIQAIYFYCACGWIFMEKIFLRISFLLRHKFGALPTHIYVLLRARINESCD